MPVSRWSPARRPPRQRSRPYKVMSNEQAQPDEHSAAQPLAVGADLVAADLSIWQRLEWLWRDVVLATLVGCLVGGSVFIVQNHFDNEREQRERTVEDARQQLAERLEDERVAANTRLENLRFVRERSSKDPDLPRPFQGLDLSDQVLNSLDLQGADFEGANLARAKLSGINLLKAQLAQANMGGVTSYGGASLVEADLRMASLESARFVAAAFTKANLIEADLTKAGFIVVYFNEADMIDADLTQSVFKLASLRNADLSGANLTSARFVDSDLSGADLSGANLTGVSLSSICRYDTPPKVDSGVQLPTREELKPCAKHVRLVP